jgi:transposase-like protein
MNGGKFQYNVQSANQLIFVRMGKRGKQNHICVDCRRQFIESRGYSDEVKRECLKMYTNGIGFRGIERVKGVHHTTVIYWVKQVGENLPDALRAR